MHPSVRDIFLEFTEPLEGLVTTMYADVKGLVTVGLGNLIDPIGLALHLPWKLPAGIPASRADVVAAWNAVKNDPQAAVKGWRYAKEIPANKVRLDRADVEELILDRLDMNDMAAERRFADWNERPADAQLAVHSLMWAMGPNFFSKFPKFTKAFTAGDYAAAAKECAISPAVGTIRERNERNRQLLLNAAAHTGDPSVLDWTA